MKIHQSPAHLHSNHSHHTFIQQTERLTITFARSVGGFNDSRLDMGPGAKFCRYRYVNMYVVIEYSHSYAASIAPQSRLSREQPSCYALLLPTICRTRPTPLLLFASLPALFTVPCLLDIHKNKHTCTRKEYSVLLIHTSSNPRPTRKRGMLREVDALARGAGGG